MDVALIARYFGSKENLFQEVLSSTLSPNNWVGVERETFGQDMVDAVSGLHASSPITDYYLLLIRAATTPFTLSVLHRLVDERIFEPFVEWVGGEDARLRTKLLLTFISGMNIHALVASGSKMLEGEDMKRFRRISADFIQRIVDGDIEMLLKGDALPASVSRSANG